MKHIRTFLICLIFVLSLFPALPLHHTRAAKTSATRSSAVKRAVHAHASQQASVTLPSPAGYWNFDEATGTAVADSSGNSHNGTLSGAATWTTGQVNSALSSNGSNYVYIGASDTASPFQYGTGSFTASAWFKTTGTSMERIISMGMGVVSGVSSYGSGFDLNVNLTCAGCVGAELGGGSHAATVSFGTTATFNDGNWHQAIMVINQTAPQTAQLYVDGVAQSLSSINCGTAAGTSVNISACSSANANSSTGPFTVGTGQNIATPWATFHPFTGGIDSVRIYGSALTSVQIKQQYLSDANPSPVGYWQLDEGSGTTTADTSGNGNTGNLSTAAPTWVTTGQVGHSNALSFNGTSNYVSIGTTPIPPLSIFQFGTTGSFSITSWFNTTPSGAGSHRIVSEGDLTSAAGYLLGVNPYTNCTCIGGGIGSVSPSTSLQFYTSTTFSTATWHKATMVIDRTAKTARMYVDGVAQVVAVTASTCGSVATDTTAINITNCGSASATGSSTNPLTIGDYNGNGTGAGEWFNGIIDEVRIYGAALNSQQILNQYMSDTNTGYWPLDENTGTSAHDFSGNNNTGILSQTSGFGLPGWNPGQVNSSLQFSGTSGNPSTGNWVTMGANDSALQFGTGSFTIMTWFKDSNTTFARIAGMGVHGWSSGFDMGINLNATCKGCILAEIGGPNSLQADSLSFYTTNATTYNDGNWHQAAMVIDQTNKLGEIFIDGAIQNVAIQYTGTCASVNTATSISFSTCNSSNFLSATNATDPFVIGAAYYTSSVSTSCGSTGLCRPMTGNLDEVRTYNVALTTQQILNQYNSDIYQAGSLSETATNLAPTFSGTIGSTQTYNLPITVSYPITPAPGWSLMITSTPLTNGSNTMPNTVSSITNVPPGVCTPTGDCPSGNSLTDAITINSGSPISLPAGSPLPSPVKFFSTTSGTTTAPGIYTITPAISVAIPGTAKVTPPTYTSTITIMAASGP